jgi:hypothetical protein
VDFASISRRSFIALAAAPGLLAAPATDARIEELTHSFEDFLYRTPYKFGGKEVDRVTVLNVRCRLATKSGKTATGAASMPLGNIWSFPATDVPYDTTLNAMKLLADRIGALTRSYPQYAHPLDINQTLEPEYLKAAADITRELHLPIAVPKLCTIVTASPFDAALHDAFGKLHNTNAFAASGKDFVRHDLSHYLNAEFKGEYLDRYIARKPAARVRMYHSVGASDPLAATDPHRPIADGLPETLEAWIHTAASPRSRSSSMAPTSSPIPTASPKSIA